MQKSWLTDCLSIMNIDCWIFGIRGMSKAMRRFQRIIFHQKRDKNQLCHSILDK
jgi:hypothetical protein